MHPKRSPKGNLGAELRQADLQALLSSLPQRKARGGKDGIEQQRKKQILNPQQEASSSSLDAVTYSTRIHLGPTILGIPDCEADGILAKGSQTRMAILTCIL